MYPQYMIWWLPYAFTTKNCYFAKNAKLTSRLNANYFGNDVCEVSEQKTHFLNIFYDHGNGQFPTQPPPRRKQSVLLGRLRQAGGKQNRNSRIHTGHQKQDLVYTSHYPWDWWDLLYTYLHLVEFQGNCLGFNHLLGFFLQFLHF